MEGITGDDMSTPISDTFGVQLTQMRRDLLDRIRAQRGGTRSRAEAAADARDIASDDWAKADEEFDLSVAQEEREAAELLAIDNALKRVADGTYGLCLQCGTSIPTARLHAQPTAERCVDCQAKAE
jgi:DnaK suppressor protein